MKLKYQPVTLAERLKLPVARVMQILELGDPAYEKLMTPCWERSFISRRSLEYIIPCLKLTASKYKLSSLSANQIEFSTPIMVIHKNLQDRKWEEYESTPEAYDVFINPKVTIKNNLKKTEEDWESCPSIPEVQALCKRYRELSLSFQNTNGDWEEIESKGFEARVIQHEMDHLNGTIIIDPRASAGRIRSEDKRVQDAIMLVEAERARRKAKLYEIERNNKAVKELFQNSKIDNEAFYSEATFTIGLIYQLYTGIGNALWAKEPRNENFQDIDWLKLVNNPEEQISKRIAKKLEASKENK